MQRGTFQLYPDDTRPILSKVDVGLMIDLSRVHHMVGILDVEPDLAWPAQGTFVDPWE